MRHGDQVDKDMIAVRLTPDARMRIVGAPAYFAHRPLPASVADLMKHNCINLRLASSGGIYAWELKHAGQDIEARVRGQAVFSTANHILKAALDGAGLGFLPEEMAGEHVRAGRLVSVMEDWCPLWPGLHAYYPSRRNSSRALALVIDAIRHKG